jgi:hypothetical protein
MKRYIMNGKRRLLKAMIVGEILIIGVTIPFISYRTSAGKSLPDSQIPDKLYVVFRNDDISFQSSVEKESSLIKIFSSYQANQLFAIIPKIYNTQYFYENNPLKDSLILWQQQGYITPAIHGFTHKFNVSGEFKNLPEDTQDTLVGKACDAFNHVFTSALIFCPPWNIMDMHTINACKSHGIKIISGFRGEPADDSVQYFNANLNLLTGELPSLQDILRDKKIQLNRTILVILYHSSYDIKTADDLNQLKGILQILKTEYHGTFSDMNSLLKKYPSYLDYSNNLGINYKKAEHKIALFNYLRLNSCASRLTNMLTSSYNHVFTGEPEMANKLINSLIFKISFQTFILFFCLGSSLLMLALSIMLFVFKIQPVRNKLFRAVMIISMLAIMILQYSYFADRLKWQIFLELILYAMIAFWVPAISGFLYRSHPEVPSIEEV